MGVLSKLLKDQEDWVEELSADAGYKKLAHFINMYFQRAPL